MKEERSELLRDKHHQHHPSINQDHESGKAGSGGSGSTLRLWTTCFFVCQAAFLFGYTSAVLNGPTSIRYHNATDPNSNFTDLHFSTPSLPSSQAETATGLALVGAMLGAFGVNIPMDRFGRRWVLLFNNAFYILGTALCTFTTSFPLLVVGRFIVGIGVGVSSVVVPQLLSEIAPTSLRGALASLNQLAVTLGILVTNVVYFGFENVNNGWRYTIGLAVIPIVIQLIGFSFLPESPHWLVRSGRSEEASSTLFRLRPAGWNVSSEIEEIEEAQREANSASEGSWKELFSLRRVVIIGLGAMFFQQMTGINAVMYYSGTIFGFAEVKNQSAATIGVTALNVAVTVISVWLIDRVGKKPLLLGGISLMTISLTVAGIALIALNNETGSTQGTICVVMVLLFVAGFAVGLGAALWPILSEIFPSEIRSKGMSFCLALNWTFNLILTLTVLGLIQFFGSFYTTDNSKYGAGWVFILFAVISLFSLAFVYFLIPETKGKSLEEVQRMLKGK